MITIKQLRYALAVEKTLHFKRAADLCNISQSALSTALSELEAQCNEKIFERNNKKVMVTPIGREFLQQARKIIELVNQLEEITSPQKDPLTFPMSVGIIPTIAPYLLPNLLSNLNAQYPDSKLTIIEEQSSRLIERVRNGDIDTAILALPFPLDGLLSLEFWQEDFYWITPYESQNSQKREIKSKQIDQDRLMLLNEGHCLKDHILDACQFTEHANKQQFGATSLTTIIEMVTGNMGTTLIPEMALNSLLTNNRKLKAIHLNEPGPHRRIAFIIRPNYTRMPSIEALLALCKTSLTTKKY